MPPEKENKGPRSKTTEFEDVFGAPSLLETFNRPAALYLHEYMENYKQEDSQDTPSDDWKAATGGLIKGSRGTDRLAVSYKKGTSANDKGRWVSTVRGSMQNMPEKLRNTIYSDWIDIRFTNSFAALLLGICKNLNITCKHLERYVTKHDAMLDEMVMAQNPPGDTVAADRAQSGSGDEMDTEGDTCGEAAPGQDDDDPPLLVIEDAEHARELVEKVMRGGDVMGILVPWWDDLCSDITHVTNHIATSSDYRDHLLACEKNKATVNLHARTLVAIVHEAENNCLEYLYNYLYDNGCIPERKCSLAFDGVMVPAVDNVTDKVSNQDFLNKCATFIQGRTGFSLHISSKDIGPALHIPFGHEDMTEDIFVIEPGEDLKAADEFVKRFGGRLVVDNGRTFWCDDQNLYTDNPDRVKKGVYSAIARMKIFMDMGNHLVPYSSSSKHVDSCLKMVMAHNSLEKPGFVNKLFESSLGYIAYDDGVYCFKSKTFTPYPVEDIYFTRKINRKFPEERPSEEDMAELMHRVIDPIFPNKEVGAYFLHRIARAAAGEIFDKIWHVCIGERDSGKSLLCNLLEWAFQCFTDTFNAESFQIKPMASGDAAKAQSWMSSLEFVRIALSNEVPLGVNGNVRLDGNMVKRIASGGDKVECRTNYQDEKKIRLQATLFLCCNRLPLVDPEDAYHTLKTIDFHTKFVPQEELDNRKESCPAHWKRADSEIKKWLKQDRLIDAFTWLVFDSYGDGTMLEPPQAVTDFTSEFADGANKPEIDKVAEIVLYDPAPNSWELSWEIRRALKKAGIDITSQLVNKHIEALYGTMDPQPTYKKMKMTINGQPMNGMGWTNIRLEDASAYNERDVNYSEKVVRGHYIKDYLNENGKRDAD